MRTAIVSGAGPSGLAAANHLADAGFEVVVLEARSKSGGRASSEPVADLLVNQGPHALYLRGAGVRELDALGIRLDGWNPTARGRRGRRQRLTAVLAADAVLWADGGDVVVSARKPIHGAERTPRFLVGTARKLPEPRDVRFVRVNADPAFQLRRSEDLLPLLVIEPGDGVIAKLRIVNNPHKLAHLRPLA